jgi:hypothetical protein
MGRYYFNRHEDGFRPDREGTDLDCLADARWIACEIARDAALAELAEGPLNPKHRLQVWDEQGKSVFSIYYRDTVAE